MTVADDFIEIKPFQILERDLAAKKDCIATVITYWANKAKDWND